MKLKIDPEILSILKKVHLFLNERRVGAYLVGGFIRNSLIKKPTVDIDIAVTADAVSLGQALAAEFAGTLVLLDEANRIARVVLPPEASSGSHKQWYIDLSTVSRDIHKDLSRRDFTIDALAVSLQGLIDSPSSLEIIDPFNGLNDLKKKTVRALSEKVFEADPARLLRAVRLAADLGFNISGDTEDLIKRDSQMINRVAGERIREELVRILDTPVAGRHVRHLDRLGLLTTIIPELESTRNVEQPVEHHWDVFNHSLETVRTSDYLLHQDTLEYALPEFLEEVPWSEKLSQHFLSIAGSDITRAGLMKMAALLHDISKPETKIITNNRVRFFGHTEQGAEVTTGILDRLRFSKREIKSVETMVRYHMRPTQMSNRDLPTSRAIYRYFRDTGSNGIDILFLSLADHLAARGPDLDMEQWKWHTGQVKYILTECYNRKNVISPPKLIDGHDLIGMGLQPGPRLREILEAIREAQAAGEINSRDQALSYVKNRLL